jgi:hypothetical protein
VIYHQQIYVKLLVGRTGKIIVEISDSAHNSVNESNGDFSTVTDIPGFKRIRIVQKQLAP